MLKSLTNVAVIAAFAGLLIGFGFAEWQASHQPPPHNREQPTVANTKNSHKGYATSDPEARGKHDSTAEKGDWYDTFSAHPTEWLLVLFNLFLVAFTGLLWRSTDKLWKDGIDQLEHTRNEAGQARFNRIREEARLNEQIEIARQTVEAAKTEFISTHRPRIILREAIIGTFLEGTPISVIFHLANMGDTAGTVVRSYVRVDTVPRGPIPLLHISVEQHHDLGEIVLGPGQAILLTFKGQTPKWESNR